MKTLYLCRHAKSSWASPGMADHDRPLNERGLRNARSMARIFSDRNEQVDLLVSSTANRAITTAKDFAETLGNKSILQEPRIYEATVRTLMTVIAGLQASANNAMLFGHNPGFSELVEHLAGRSIGELPTCAIAKLDLNIDQWAEAHEGCAELVWLDSPKQHEPL